LRLFRLPPALGRRAALLLLPFCLAANPCESCHPKEVAGYSRSNMSRSLRRAANEPEGVVGITFQIRSDGQTTCHGMEREGKSAEYGVTYVIGSGSHASGHLIQAGGHFFQWPLCYFTRAVDAECLACHSGKPTAGALGQEAISCDRCHGDTAQ